MKKFIGILCLALVAQIAGAHEHPAAPTMPKEFDTMKKLIGTWEGTANMGGPKPENITVTYELTSGGTAITEKLGPGTPHEMTSIYYKDGSSIAMTHYCAMGNHPEMKMKKADGKSISFEMTKPTGLTSANEPHMHAVTLFMPDDNTLKQEWTSFAGGKKGDTATFNLKRKM